MLHWKAANLQCDVFFFLFWRRRLNFFPSDPCTRSLCYYAPVFFFYLLLTLNLSSVLFYCRWHHFQPLSITVSTWQLSSNFLQLSWVSHKRLPRKTLGGAQFTHSVNYFQCDTIFLCTDMCRPFISAHSDYHILPRTLCSVLHKPSCYQYWQLCFAYLHTIPPFWVMGMTEISRDVS